MIARAAARHEAGLHGLEIIFITLTTSEDEKFTSFIAAIKIESSQRSLTTSSINRQVTNGFPWFKSAMKLNCVNKSPTGSPTSSNTAFLRQEVVGVSPTSSVREEETSLGCLVKVEPRNISRADSFILHLGALINFLQLRLRDLRQASDGRLVSAPGEAVDLVNEVVLVALAATVHEQLTSTFQRVVVISELFPIAAARVVRQGTDEIFF